MENGLILSKTKHVNSQNEGTIQWGIGIQLQACLKTFTP